jgi:hypothetical protein
MATVRSRSHLLRRGILLATDAGKMGYPSGSGTDANSTGVEGPERLCAMSEDVSPWGLLVWEKGQLVEEPTQNNDGGGNDHQ